MQLPNEPPVARPQKESPDPKGSPKLLAHGVEPFEIVTYVQDKLSIPRRLHIFNEGFEFSPYFLLERTVGAIAGEFQVDSRW